MKYAFTVQYDGSKFNGFQIQPDVPTIQGELEKAIHIKTRKHYRIHMAGRTDTGVHALGQVIHLELDNNIEKFNSIDSFIYSLNCILPSEISIIHGSEVPDDFHARFSCTGREYLYKIVNNQFRMALYEKKSLWIRSQLDIPKIQEAANLLKGEHDFAAFTKTIYSKNNEPTIRRIDDIQIIDDKPFVSFYYKGSGFLHNMIRILTGTLLMIGKNKLSVQEFENIFHKKDRTLAGITLPPNGLYFLNALYDDYKSYELKRKFLITNH